MQRPTVVTTMDRVKRFLEWRLDVFLKPTLLITTIVTVVVMSSVALLALSPRAALGQDDPLKELAERYAPVITLKAQEAECDSNGEQYAPMAADTVLDNPQILLRQLGNGDPVVVVGPSAADLHGLGEGFYLDFPGDALAPGCLYEKDFRRYTEERPAVVYAHVATQDDAPGQLALQYWFFYYYNNYTNLHEGDWEGIQLLFNAGTVADALTVDPVSIGYSQHFGGERADWTSDKLERRGTHPVVYPAVGSHASYFNSSLYLGRSSSEGLGCDNTEGPSVALEPDVIILPDAIDDRNDPLAWLAFEGLWGERGSGPFSGPTGPATKDRWTAPIDWHDTLHSAKGATTRQSGRSLHGMSRGASATVAKNATSSGSTHLRSQFEQANLVISRPTNSRTCNYSHEIQVSSN